MPCQEKSKWWKQATHLKPMNFYLNAFWYSATIAAKYFYLKIVTIVSFYALWKHRKTKGFLIFSGGMKSDHCNYFCLKSPEAANGVLGNFANFTGKHLLWCLFLIKLKAFWFTTSWKRDSKASAFPWNLRNF